MTKHSNIFEAVFEDYLQERGLPYIATNESRRSRVNGKAIKNVDFIVTSPRKECALVDVKGKCQPANSDSSGHSWENWINGDDIDGMTFWESCFGRNFTALFVFIYELADPAGFKDFEVIHCFRGKAYGMVGLSLETYFRNMKLRSVRWNTRSIPKKVFRKIARPVTAFL